MSRRSAPVKTHDLVDVTVERLAQGGRGVARHEGFVLFVARGLPGDTVRARVTRVKRSFAEAVAEEVVTRGATTIDAPCGFHDRCGGCAWQGYDYASQLAAKQQQVIEAIERIGGVGNPPVAPIVPAEEQFGYRNKMEYTFATTPDGLVGAGFHMLGRWDQLVTVDPCLIADERGIAAQRTVVAWANRHEIPVFDHATGEGYLRNLVVRVGRNTGEIMVNLATAPGKLVRAAELVDDLQAEVPGIVSVMHTENPGQAQVVPNDVEPQLLWGRPYFEEVLAGVRLRVGPTSFLQPNTQMAERMYALIREVAQLRPDDIAYDLYCGIGSISLMLAREVDQVVGVEVVPQAIADAIANAELNGIDNAEFQVGNVRPILKHAEGVWPDPTLVVVDPPRSGLVQKVVRRICERRPERIVYMSCNPSTFATDLPCFAEHGYALTFVQAVDQFPHTHHVELVARLEPIPGWEPPVVEEDATAAAAPADDAAAETGTDFPAST